LTTKKKVFSLRAHEGPRYRGKFFGGKEGIKEYARTEKKNKPLFEGPAGPFLAFPPPQCAKPKKRENGRQGYKDYSMAKRSTIQDTGAKQT